MSVCVRLWPFTILMVLTRVDGFVLSSGGFKWTVPADSGSGDGLGGGIAFVVNQSFCDSIIQRFPERDLIYGLTVSSLQFVHCSDLMNALQRGFSTWSSNHRLISFTDITSTPVCKQASSRAGDLSDSCPWELYIGTDDGTTYFQLAAYVLNYRSSSIYSDWSSRGVRTASGVQATGDAHARSFMRFQTHLCWYLDATFCYYFQMWQEEHNMDVLLIVRLVCAGLFGIAALRLVGVVLWALLACHVGERNRIGANVLLHDAGSGTKPPGCCAEACTACLNYLASLSPVANVLLIFFLIFPPIFYERIFLPCWECYDFEAAVAHEIGHVLGFGHPDTTPAENLVATCTMTNATCRDSFSCAEKQMYEASMGSIMHSLTQRVARTCLSNDDLDGLHMLYPLCDGSHPTAVSCVKGRILSGWLRLALVSGAPFLIAVALVLLPLTCVRWRDKRRMKKLDQQLGNARNVILEYRAKIEEAEKAIIRERVMGVFKRGGNAAAAIKKNANTPGTALNLVSTAATAAQEKSARLVGQRRNSVKVVPEQLVRRDSLVRKIRTSEHDGQEMVCVDPPALKPPPKLQQPPKTASRRRLSLKLTSKAEKDSSSTEKAPVAAPRPSPPHQQAYSLPAQPRCRGAPSAQRTVAAPAVGRTKLVNSNRPEQLLDAEINRAWEKAGEDIDQIWQEADREGEVRAQARRKPSVGV